MITAICVGMQETETKRLLVHLVQRPHDFRDHLRHFAGSLVLRIAYGYKTLDQDDPMIKVAERALQAISTAGTPGKWMVDIIPARKCLKYCMVC